MYYMSAPPPEMRGAHEILCLLLSLFMSVFLGMLAFICVEYSLLSKTLGCEWVKVFAAGGGLRSLLLEGRAAGVPVFHPRKMDLNGADKRLKTPP